MLFNGRDSYAEISRLANASASTWVFAAVLFLQKCFTSLFQASAKAVPICNYTTSVKKSTGNLAALFAFIRRFSSIRKIKSITIFHTAGHFESYFACKKVVSQEKEFLLPN